MFVLVGKRDIYLIFLSLPMTNGSVYVKYEVLYNLNLYKHFLIFVVVTR